MALFLNLYLGHLLGDFVLQPGRLVLAKRDSVAGLLLHTSIIGLCSAVVVIGTIGMDWVAVLAITGCHLAIERLTILTYLKTPTRGLFTLVFDQVMHLLSIVLVVWLLGRFQIDTKASTFGMQITVAHLAYATGLLTAALLGSILAFESVNAWLASGPGKGTVLHWDVPRMAGMCERAAAVIAAIALHPAAIVLPFIPRLLLAMKMSPDDRARQAVEAAAGLALCLVVYGAVQLVALLLHNGLAPGTSAFAFLVYN